MRDNVICMIGTDHGLAPADVRSAFSLPADVRGEVLALARARLGASGVVLLATCNRTELWASFDGVEPPARSLDERGAPKSDDPLLQTICDMHMVESSENTRYFACHSGEAAVDHLFNVACGLRSAIVAEDQIISQVKQAIAFSREIGLADGVLEVLFRQAVAAAKHVKSGVRFTRAYATAVDQAVAMLQAEGVRLEDTTCMVIGNGEYGRLAASTLVDCGARVLVTVRSYTHGTVTVPRGCESIPYADRYEHIDQCQVIMSATASPHYTLERDEFAAACGNTSNLHVVDLAIPNDIDPAIADLQGCALHNIDSFATDIGSENAKAIEAAQRLLASGEAEFWDWMDRRDAMTQFRPPAGPFFPLFMDLTEKHVVFVGGGTIALRRIRTLLPFVNEIVVCAPDFTPELERFADGGAITLIRQEYDSSVLEGASIVFACTNDPELNDEIWEECRNRNILVNVCSDRYKCDFYFPGVVQNSGLVVGISAGGKDHRRVRQLRARIERLIEEEDL